MREPTPILDSRDTYSEQWRRECEARSVLGLPFNQRKQHLNDIEKIRGKAARQYLEEEIIRQWKKSPHAEG